MKDSMAILYPALSFRVAASTAILSVLLIAVLAMSTPALAESCSALCGFLITSFALSQHIPEVARMSTDSSFPLATGVAYFSALVLGALTALQILFARFGHLNFAAVHVGGARGRILRFLGYALWAAQFFVAAPRMNEQQISYGFFAAVGSDRAFMLAWMEGMYVLSVVVLVAMITDVSQILRSREQK